LNQTWDVKLSYLVWLTSSRTRYYIGVGSGGDDGTK
jgi:hypothetical protein